MPSHRLSTLATYLTRSASAGTVWNPSAVFRYLRCRGSRWWSQGWNIRISLPVSWKEGGGLAYGNWTFVRDGLGLQKLNSTLLEEKYVSLCEWARTTIVLKWGRKKRIQKPF